MKCLDREQPKYLVNSLACPSATFYITVEDLTFTENYVQRFTSYIEEKNLSALQGPVSSDVWEDEHC